MDKSKITINDFLDIKKVEDIKVNGDFLYFVEKSPNSVEKGYKSQIKRMNLKDNSIKQFTIGNKRDYSPKVSPDGHKMAFISTRFEKPQIFIMDIDGGEGIPLTEERFGVISYNWSPTSDKIVYQALTDFDENDDKTKPLTKYEVDRLSAEKEEKERLKSDPKVINRWVYRTGTSFLDETKFSQIYVINLSDKSKKRISKGSFNYSGAEWLDNGHVIALVKKEEPIDLTKYHHVVKLSITEESEGEVLSKIFVTFFPQTPIVNEYNRKLILLDHIDENKNPAGQNNRLAILKEDGTTEFINQKLDRGVGNIRWISPDKGFIMVEDTGFTDIRLFNLNDFSFNKLYEPQQSVESFDFRSENEFYFSANSPTHPSALWKWNKDNGVTLVYDPNEKILSEREISEPEVLWFENPEGLKYQGWYFEAGKKDGKKPGLVLSVHGGPHSMWNNAGTMWHEWQVTVSRGYSVLALNPIGSSGYGEDFSQIITSKWGVDDARDLLLALDKVVETKEIDKEKLYVTGGSYAGFQTANIITRDHRFKAACSQRGVYDCVTFGLATDIPFFMLWEWGGEPWDQLNHLWDHSPLGRAKEIQTPLLIIHSENDFRVQISQGENLFGALKLLNKEVQMVRYPRDGHELSRGGEPLHIIDRLERMLDWFDSHP